MHKMLARTVVLDDSPWNLVTTMTSPGDSCTVCISREATVAKIVDVVMKESFCDYQLDEGLFCDNNCWGYSYLVDLFWGFHPYMSLFLPLENFFGHLPDFLFHRTR